MEKRDGDRVTKARCSEDATSLRYRPTEAAPVPKSFVGTGSALSSATSLITWREQEVLHDGWDRVDDWRFGERICNILCGLSSATVYI